MPTVREIEAFLYRFAPKELAMDWDNVGLLLGDPDREVTRILVALDITETVAQEAIDGGCEPGKIFHLRGDEIKNHFPQKISAHEVGIQDVLTMLELTGKKIPHIELIGAQPYSLEAGTELTEPMQKLLPIFANKAVEILKSWGLEIIGN